MTELMPHQLEAKQKLRNGCILRGGMGSGKTLTALAYYADNESLERLIVITTAKKRSAGDWQAEARLLGIYPEVDSWQRLWRYRDVQGAFFIFDEQRVVGSGPWVSSFLKITRNNQWILLSATPGDSWMDYIPVFCANGFYSTRTEFIQEHVVFAPFVKFPKVVRYLNEAKLERLLDRILIDMPYEKHTVRHVIDVFASYDREKYDRAWVGRWNEDEDRPIRHVSELFAIIRKIANTDPSRLMRIRDIMIEHPRVVIFYNFDYELEILRELDCEIAEWNGHKHEKIPGGSEWAYLVQYMAGSEGWNCTETDTVIFYSLTYSYRMFEQAKGRIDRLDTPFVDLYYFVISGSSSIDVGITRALSAKKNFNERECLKGQNRGYDKSDTKIV